METISKRDAIDLATLNHLYREAITHFDLDNTLEVDRILTLNAKLALLQDQTGVVLVSGKLLDKDYLELSRRLRAI